MRGLASWTLHEETPTAPGEPTLSILGDVNLFLGLLDVHFHCLAVLAIVQRGLNVTGHESDASISCLLVEIYFQVVEV